MAGNRIRFAAEFDDNGVARKLRGVSDAFDKLGGKGSGASLFGNVGAKVVAGGFNLISDAASAAIGFAFDSIDAFSKLQQATGGLDAVFGSSSGVIEKYAETSAESFGRSERAVFESAAIIGAKLTGMGLDVDDAATTFVDLDKRAADMAATFGGDATEAINAISSALTGERDPIERYGVSIKEADVQARILALGLANVTAEEKKQATATATLSLIMDGTAKAAGGFARETDTLAGKQAIANAKMEEAQAKLGEKLAPLMERFTQFMIDVGIPAITAIADAFEEVGSAIAGAIAQLNIWLGKSSAFPREKGKYLPNGLPSGGSKISGKAAGGWVGLNGPEVVLTGERGPEYVVPNDQLGGGGGHGHDIYMDGRIVGRLMDRHLASPLQRAAMTSAGV